MRLRDVVFTDQNTGYIVGEYKALKSTDGGNTWFWLPSDGSEAVAAVGTKLAYINTADVVVSSDQGATLTQIPGTTVSVNQNLLRDIDLLDQNTIITCGAVGGVFKSTDFGITWSDVSHSTSQNIEMDFIDANNGWMATTNGIITKTTDGGSTWTDIDTISGMSWVYDISFANASTGFAVAENSSLMKSTDGGLSWTAETVSGAASGVATWRGVHALRPTYAFAVGDNGYIAKLDLPNGITKPEKQTFSVSPVPSNGILQINLPESSDLWTLRIFNLTGNLLAEKQSGNAVSMTLKLDFPDGLYLIQATSGEQQYLKKFILSR